MQLVEDAYINRLPVACNYFQEIQTIISYRKAILINGTFVLLSS